MKQVAKTDNTEGKEGTHSMKKEGKETRKQWVSGFGAKEEEMKAGR